jgi:hypothetical protein
VDPSGRLTPGTTDATKAQGVWRIPVQGLRHDPKAWAVVLIPNVQIPTVSNVDVDVLLHFHGYGVGYRMLKPKEQESAKVLQPGQLRDINLYEIEQQLLDFVKTKKKFVIAVLPQGSDRSDFGTLPKDSGPYLKEIFDRLIADKYLPAGAGPGNVTLSGHSGGGVPATTAARTRGAAGRQDLLLFDAINYRCVEKVQMEKNGEKQFNKDGSPKMTCKRCESNEYRTVSKWVTDHIRSDASFLVTAKKLKDLGTRFRGFTHVPLSTKDTCSYGHWYGKLKSDIDKAIADLDATSDAKNQLQDNFQVRSVPGPEKEGKAQHEKVMAHGALEAALAD